MSEIIDDIRIEAENPPGTYPAGRALSVTLQFFNLSAVPRVLFFIESETYRFGLSTFRFRSRSGPTEVQPMARDGYFPRESDFHAIGPRGQLTFTQKLVLSRTVPPGALTVEWTYQNAMDSYPSKLSNGGELIPGIWRGKLTHDFKVKVTR